MTTTVKPLDLNARTRHGRAVNAVAELLRARLSVPNIYLEPRNFSIDVLAVDRAGAGDLHAVEIKLENDFQLNAESKPPSLRNVNQKHRLWMQNLRKKVQLAYGQLMSVPAHYRYFAIPKNSESLLMGELSPLGLFAADGIGRLGVIIITDRDQDPPLAEMLIAPERFRVDGEKLSGIENKILSKIRPDIEVRI